MAVDPTPAGYPSVIPYLAVDGAAEAIEFYKTVFGATERMRMPAPDGRIGHAEIEIGAGVVMLADLCPEARPGAEGAGRKPGGRDGVHPRRRRGLRGGDQVGCAECEHAGGQVLR